MKSPHQIGLLLGVIVLGLSASGSMARAESSQPTITSIQLDKTNVLITAQVPTGLKRLILQGSQGLGSVAWQPRAVVHLDGKGGLVTFQVIRSPDLEMIRVRADESDPLPGLFYKGTNVFQGVVTGTSTVNPGDLVFSLAPTAAVNAPVPNGSSKDATPPRTVVESDIWQVDGSVLYFFNQYRGLQVIDLTNPDSPAVRGTLSLPAVGEQMYVLGDQQVVLLARNDCSGSANSGSQVLIVNTAGTQPSIIATLPLDGQIQESRLVGTALYVMTQTYKAVPDSKDGSWEWGTSLSAFDLSNPTTPVTRPRLWYSGNGNVLSATDRYLFVSMVGSSGSSQVQCIDISAPDGTMQTAAAISVAGNVTDKFKMNLNGDVFTVISENWSYSKPSGRWGPTTVLETFSLADPSAPKMLGKLQLANGEQLHATRFDGDRVYVVTYFQVDPLWVVDLSDPTNPAVKGEVKVPGWSTYIQPLGDRLLTIGIDNTNGWRVAVSLFDVHDPAAPNLLSKVPLGQDSSWSEATVDEKAFGFLPDAGLILVPYSSYSTNVQQGVQLIDYSRDSLTKRGFISHDVQARRSTINQNRILSISGLELLDVDASDRDNPAVRSTTTLAWSVDKVFVQGNYLVEVDTSNSSGNAVPPVVRVVLKAAPDSILSSVTLTNLPVWGATVRDGYLYVLQGLTKYPSPIIFVADGSAQPAATNQSTLVCSVLDLSKLPELGAINSTTTTTEDAITGEADPIWPKSDLLVWVMQQSYYWTWWRPIPLGGPALINSQVVDAPTGRGVSLLPTVGSVFLYPYGAYGDSKLYAVDVKDRLDPQFVSQVNLTTTNGWASYSKPFTADNSVFLSQQITETTITSTNYQVLTNRIYVLMTNTVVVTNYTQIPKEITQTNFTTGTNITIVSVRNKLGDQSVLDPSANASVAFAQVINGGAFHSMALAADGQVWTWGGNGDGQLGDVATADRPELKAVAGLGSLASVVSGSLHNLALKSDGTVWAWGNGVFGQLGTGASPQDPNLPPMPDLGGPIPVPVMGLGGITGVAAGNFHSLALQSDGTVWAWGGNWAGQIGNGTFENQNSPIPVMKMSDVIQVAGGNAHSLALKKDGTVWAWGANDAGQLGFEPMSDGNVPALVNGLNGVIAIASGHSHNLALTKDGTVWAWGRNDSGQLGNGTNQNQALPTPIADLKDVTAVACGQSHSLALKRDGSVWAWGKNQDAQVAVGTQLDTSKPIQVAQLPTCRAIAAGESHSLAVSAKGEVYAWGKNDHGQLGNGDVLTQTNIYSSTNYFTTTTWTTVVDVGLRTNLVKVPQDSVFTNVQPVYTSRQVFSLRVIDYTAPATPVPRPPVSIPGTLRGLSREGALVYLVGTDLNAATPDGSEWLHACSYDGVSCYLVDSHPLPKDWPHTVLVQDPYVYITRPEVDKTNPRALEVWTMSDAAKLSKLHERGLAANASSVLVIGDLLVSQEDTGLELFDLGSPVDLPLVGQGSPSGCIGWSVNQAAGSTQDGLWLPLGLYGIDQIEVKK